jgi:HSP20 family protein
MPSEMLRGSFPGNLFESILNNSFMAGFNTSMRSDIKETNQEYILEVEIPGFSKENINVECQDGLLTISAVNMQDTDDNTANYVRQERQFGKISRSYRIDGIDEDQILAEYRDGILRLTLPKSNETNEKRKRIAIH